MAAHARKMVAKLWELGKKENNKNWPVYYYENIEGGHGGAADAKQSAFMTTLAYDFMMPWPDQLTLRSIAHRSAARPEMRLVEGRGPFVGRSSQDDPKLLSGSP